MRISALPSLLSAATLAFSFSVVSSPVAAQAPAASNGYVQSMGGTVRSGSGACVRTGYWTPSPSLKR
jgi:hypothetical protein